MGSGFAFEHFPIAGKKTDIQKEEGKNLYGVLPSFITPTMTLSVYFAILVTKLTYLAYLLGLFTKLIC